MSDQNSLFVKESQETPENTQPDTSALSAYEQKLASIKNENGEQKYKSLDDALKALEHSQSYIPKLKSEYEELVSKYEEQREKENKMSELEQTIADLVASKEQKGDKEQDNTFKPEDIDAYVQKALIAREQEALRKQNVTTVVNALNRHYGEENAEQMFYAKAQELGISAEEMNELAQKSPTLVLNALGVSGQVAHKQTAFAPPKSALNTGGIKETKESVIGRSKHNVLSGATSSQVKEEVGEAARMVQELIDKGLPPDYYSDPKNFFRDLT